MKKNFWSWVPTDRPWALYPLKANSHSACLNILAQPLPSHSRHALEPPPPSLPLLSLSPPLSPFNPNAAPSPSVDWEPQLTRSALWVGGWDAGAGREREREREGERGGESPIVGLDSTLSSLEHPLMGGAHWQSRILIWLCKCLLQKAMRCNPHPVVGRQSEEEGRKDGRTEGRTDGRKESRQQECGWLDSWEN